MAFVYARRTPVLKSKDDGFAWPVSGLAARFDLFNVGFRR
jgi:hypothetical protein